MLIDPKYWHLQGTYIYSTKETVATCSRRRYGKTIAGQKKSFIYNIMVRLLKLKKTCIGKTGADRTICYVLDVPRYLLPLNYKKNTDYVSSVGIYLKDLYRCMYTVLSIKLWNKLFQIIEEIGSVFKINPTNLLQIATYNRKFSHCLIKHWMFS